MMAPPICPSEPASGEISARTVTARGPILKMASGSPRFWPVFEAGMEHPGEPIVVSHDAAKERAPEL